MIIGLVGMMGSGKGEIVKLVLERGFKYVRLSDMVREEAARRGLDDDRTILQDVGNQMRAQGGVGVLAERALERIRKEGGDWAVDGIRNPGEIDALCAGGKNIWILGVHAGKEEVVRRILGRAREGDAQERREIEAKIEREWGIGEPADGQQVGRCMEMADEVLDNMGTLAELGEKFEKYYERISSDSDLSDLDVRPSKDEYYLDLAKSVARRATCLKVQIGAVIIRDDQVVATGYCGAPRGTKSSLEHGFCLRQKLGIPSGHRYEMCRSVHAEQNAIINAARSGTSLYGGDMYIYGERRDGKGGVAGTGQILDAFPCFICKKMLINCGLDRVVCSLADGGFKVFTTDEWIADWKEQDIIDDKHQYGEATAGQLDQASQAPIKIGGGPAAKSVTTTHDEVLD
jgi:dCMP deaminase